MFEKEYEHPIPKFSFAFSFFPASKFGKRKDLMSKNENKNNDGDNDMMMMMIIVMMLIIIINLHES